MLSKRAARNGRIPIIAVSASLIEKERQIYIDAGFDGWILKPIAFDRLKHIMLGIVDAGARKENLYKSGGTRRLVPTSSEGHLRCRYHTYRPDANDRP
jgi:DNA-binding response OmpR family regulator